MPKRIVVFCIALTCSLSACALGDVTVNTTPLPPITLPPPPALNLVGSCDDTKALETWLQVSTELRENFQTQMNAAAAKSKNDMYGDIINLSALRDSGFGVATPDCAADAGMKLSDAMNLAVGAFQSFFNSTDSSNLDSTVVDINYKLDSVQATQIELVKRMDSQFQTRYVTPTPSP
ncbi:MAG: hypothetical protein ABI690_28495 [Chloroflexota bacterium]